MNETLTIRLDARSASALHKEATQTGLSEGVIARQALKMRLANGGAPSVMRQHFGIIRGPADPSTNKAHRHSWKQSHP
jgi:hypothetical protein